jgi:hypothetical protein
MIPQRYDVPFVKQSELQLGVEAMINSEFKPDAKFKSPLVGNVIIKNEEKLLGINWGSVRAISEAYGEDTLNWMGKLIVFHGNYKRKENPSAGYYWGAKGGQKP